MTAPPPARLPLELSQDVAQQLAFIRYLFGLGERQAVEAEPLAAAAVLMFHDSIELFLVLVAERLQVLTPNMPFMKYFGDIDARIQPEALAERGAMVRLNNARINFKHYSNLPRAAAVEEFRRSARAFFEE